jgi:hypothetical protein
MNPYLRMTWVSGHLEPPGFSLQGPQPANHQGNTSYGHSSDTRFTRDDMLADTHSFPSELAFLRSLAKRYWKRPSRGDRFRRCLINEIKRESPALAGIAERFDAYPIGHYNSYLSYNSRLTNAVAQAVDGTMRARETSLW